jgi:hypothetical protein
MGMERRGEETTADGSFMPQVWKAQRPDRKRRERGSTYPFWREGAGGLLLVVRRSTG